MTEELAARHQELLNRFIDLANTIKEEGNDPHFVSSALMAASAVYATYAAAGNRGYLQDSGIDRVAEIFRQHLVTTRELRKAELGQGSEPSGV